ncbi:hypothetical protein PROFUN_12994 [Planoprotostelium fungivorum]|uniref:Uncharacterized protein n=1 Tax=Planoprotostelium fungivorum TaxID=1890364 RepID=A0A2P6N614_9EUKA|nr:hypothetical protein PROFUN_12994 [Planoprotostelium fungivorum]
MEWRASYEEQFGSFVRVIQLAKPNDMAYNPPAEHQTPAHRMEDYREGSLNNSARDNSPSTQRPDSPPDGITDEKLIPVVFIPGLKGSSLYSKEGRKIWINKMQALGLDNPRLDLPLEWYKVDDDPDDPDGHLLWRQRSDGVRAGKVIKQMLKVSIYRNFMNDVKAKGRPFYEFAYDWRRDCNEAAHLLSKKLLAIYEQHRVPIQVVSHSMGGLITYAVVNDPKFTHLFHSALFVGCPFSQEITFLEYMHAGQPEGLNTEILSPQVLFTCGSAGVFYPFPDNPKVYGYKDRTHRPRQYMPSPESDEELEQQRKFMEEYPWLTIYDIDFYSPEDWLRHKIGIYSIDYENLPWKLPPNTTPEQVREVLFEHQRRALHQSRLRFNPDIAYPPMAVLRTSNVPTLSRVLKNGPKSVRGYDFESLPKSDGDGRVVASATLLPRGVPHVVYTCKLDHTFQMNDPNIIKILSILTSHGGDPRWFEKPTKTEELESKTLLSDYIKKFKSLELRPFRRKSQGNLPPTSPPKERKKGDSLRSPPMDVEADPNTVVLQLLSKLSSEHKEAAKFRAEMRKNMESMQNTINQLTQDRARDFDSSTTSDYFTNRPRIRSLDNFLIQSVEEVCNKVEGILKRMSEGDLKSFNTSGLKALVLSQCGKIEDHLQCTLMTGKKIDMSDGSTTNVDLYAETRGVVLLLNLSYIPFIEGTDTDMSRIARDMENVRERSLTMLENSARQAAELPANIGRQVIVVVAVDRSVAYSSTFLDPHVHPAVHQD